MGSVVKKSVWKRYQHSNLSNLVKYISTKTIAFLFDQTMVLHTGAKVVVPPRLEGRKINTRCLRINCQENKSSYILTMFDGSIMIKEEEL